MSNRDSLTVMREVWNRLSKEHQLELSAHHSITIAYPEHICYIRRIDGAKEGEGE